MVMAEAILRIPLTELQTIRLVCKRDNCGGVAEIPTMRLDAIVGQVRCPSCGQTFNAKQVGSMNALKGLGLVIKSLATEEGFAVEFVVPSTE